MFKDIGDIVGKNIQGSNGAKGRAQGVLVALVLGMGAVKVLRAGLAIDWFFWRQFMRPKKNLKKKYGSWAAVTGATDGIGRAYCDQLAKQGLNILLISRTKSKLDAAAAEIASTHGVETKTFSMDLVAAGNLSCEGPEWQSLKAVLSELDIVVKTCYSVLPGMLERGRGAIVNISSAAGTPNATPCVAVYGATKAFVDHFSKSLNAEYKSQGIDVQAQIPAYVSTKMVGHKKPDLMTPTADRYTESAIRHIGYESMAVPYCMHALERPMYKLPKEIGDPMLKPAFLALRDKTLKTRAEAGVAKAE